MSTILNNNHSSCGAIGIREEWAKVEKAVMEILRKPPSFKIPFMETINPIYRLVLNGRMDPEEMEKRLRSLICKYIREELCFLRYNLRMLGEQWAEFKRKMQMLDDLFMHLNIRIGNSKFAQLRYGRIQFVKIVGNLAEGNGENGREDAKQLLDELHSMDLARVHVKGLQEFFGKCGLPLLGGLDHFCLLAIRRNFKIEGLLRHYPNIPAEMREQIRNFCFVDFSLCDHFAELQISQNT